MNYLGNPPILDIQIITFNGRLTIIHYWKSNITKTFKEKIPQNNMKVYLDIIHPQAKYIQINNTITNILSIHTPILLPRNNC